MRYTPEEKQRMDRLLAVFADYVADSTEIDVAYSDKTGYVRLIVDEGADAVFFLIKDFDDMLTMFIDDIFADCEHSVIYLNERGTAHGFQRAYQHLHKVLSALDVDRAYALAKLEERYEYTKTLYHVKDL